MHRVQGSPLSCVFYELYASREAHVSNEATEHMKRAYAQLNQYVESVRVEYLDAPIGKGLLN